MGKMQAQQLATAAQAGVTRVGPGIRVTAGVIDAVRPLTSLWVHVDGNDSSGDGSMGNPFQTLARVFAFIAANPWLGGYTVLLPSGTWMEAVGLPPPGTRLVGQGAGRTRLEGPGATKLLWSEGEAGQRTFENMDVHADITGADGGNLALVFRGATVGMLTLVGQVDLCASGFAALVNCANVRVVDSPSTPLTAFSLSYDPTAGTNGPGATYNVISGGLWGDISYSSTDSTVPLYVLGAQVMGSLTAAGSAVVDAIATRALLLQASQAASVVAYDGPVNDVEPMFSGLGRFKNAWLTLKATVPPNFGTGDRVIAVPPQVATTLKNVFALANTEEVGVSYVASTFNSLTLRVTAPALHPSYELRVLVKP